MHLILLKTLSHFCVMCIHCTFTDTVQILIKILELNVIFCNQNKSGKCLG